MDEAQQSNMASDPDSNGSVTTFIHMGLIPMLYSNTKKKNIFHKLQKEGRIFCTAYGRKDFSCDLLHSQPGRDRILSTFPHLFERPDSSNKPVFDIIKY